MKKHILFLLIFTLTVTFLTNSGHAFSCSAFQTELKYIQKFKLFGGSEDLNLNSQEWDDRFAKATYYLNRVGSEEAQGQVSYAWNVLDSIRPGQWQMVADIKNQIVYFRSDVGKKIKCINLSKCDFSKKSVVKYIDMNSDKQGDVTNQLINLTTEDNDEYVMKGFPIGYENPEFYNSGKYINLKRNLHDYVFDRLR